MKIEIDVAEFAAQLKAGKGIGSKDGALTPPIKQLTEMALYYKKMISKVLTCMMKKLILISKSYDFYHKAQPKKSQL